MYSSDKWLLPECGCYFGKTIGRNRRICKHGDLIKRNRTRRKKMYCTNYLYFDEEKKQLAIINRDNLDIGGKDEILLLIKDLQKILGEKFGIFTNFQLYDKLDNHVTEEFDNWNYYKMHLGEDK